MSGLMPSGDGLRDEDWERRHRLLTWTMITCAILLTGLGITRNQIGLDWLSSMILISGCTLGALFLPGRRLPASAVALGLTIACCELVIMANGLTEAHFSFFVAVAALALYRDWFPFGVFLAAGMAGHVFAAVFIPDRAFDHMGSLRTPWAWTLIHGTALLIVAAIQVILWRLAEAEEHRASDDLNQAQTQLSAALQLKVREDSLTRLLGRSAFEADLAELIEAEAGQVSVIFIDVDRFKAINDSQGHGAGDEVLRTLGLRLAALVPDDAVLARLGGDEFAIALPGRVSRAGQLGEAIVELCQAPFVVPGGQLAVTVSIGICAVVPGEDAEATLQSADMAMYAAKHSGRDRIKMFDDTMRLATQRRVAAEQLLRAALDGDRALALPVWFQPIVSLTTRRIIGAEALVRLRTEDGHLVAPIVFIPIAEETGLVIPLGQHVLRTALTHLQAWGERLPYVSVNVSPRQLSEVGFVPMLIEELAVSGLQDPSRLVLEITETSMLHSGADLRRRLDAIKDLGVRLALDDFGTGYSSLTWLQSVPADIVKLDRSFVAGLATDPGKAAIISAVLWLAKALGMSVIAEGVEEIEDAELLAKEGCPAVQGYLFSRPLEPEGMRKLLTGPIVEFPSPRPASGQVPPSDKLSRTPPTIAPAP
jgi:diguanylate cyclase (GGDEF)-like protein